MKQLELARLYLRKAEEDEAVLDAVMDLDSVSDAIFGFHCQQAAEKLLKALLVRLGVRFRKTHDLQELMSMLEDVATPLPADLSDIDSLTPFAVDFRYEDTLEALPFDRSTARLQIARLRAYVVEKVAEQGRES